MTAAPTVSPLPQFQLRAHPRGHELERRQRLADEKLRVQKAALQENHVVLLVTRMLKLTNWLYIKKGTTCPRFWLGGTLAYVVVDRYCTMESGRDCGEKEERTQRYLSHSTSTFNATKQQTQHLAVY